MKLEVWAGGADLRDPGIWLELHPSSTGREEWARTKPREVLNLTTWPEEKPGEEKENKRCRERSSNLHSLQPLTM